MITQPCDTQLVFDANDLAPLAARRHTLGALSAWGLGATAVDAMLIVSELVTNAIRYGGPQVRLTVTYHPPELRLAVWDASSLRPQAFAVASDAEAGRGLLLVSQLAHEWGWVPEAGGKTVHATILLLR